MGRRLVGFDRSGSYPGSGGASPLALSGALNSQANFAANFLPLQEGLALRMASEISLFHLLVGVIDAAVSGDRPLFVAGVRRVRGIKEVNAALEGIARDIDREVARVIRDSTRRRVVPLAKRLGPSIVSDSLVAAQTAGGAALTTNATGMRRRIVGITNYGGVVASPIVPKRAKALKLKNGGIVARVDTPRRVTGTHYLETAVEREIHGVTRDLAREVPKIMRRRLG